MGRYLKKNYKEDEKKMISTRVRTCVIDAFQKTSEDASLNGFTLSLSSVVEEALKHAISEYKDETGKDFLKSELDKLHQEWINEQEDDFKKHQEKTFLDKAEFDNESIKEMEESLQKEFDNQRKIKDMKDTKALLSLNPEDAKKYTLKKEKEDKAQDKENLKTLEDEKEKHKLLNRLFEEKTKEHINLFSKSADYIKVMQDMVKDANIDEFNHIFKEVDNEK